MKNYHVAAAFAALLTLLSGCQTKGGWRGAEAEKAYDKELETKQLAEILNNEDYYEFERDERIYVLSGAKDYNTYLKTNEVGLSTKKIGGGPGGKTIVYGLIKNEAKMMEKDPKAQGAAQRMYEGQLRGLDKDFFGLVKSSTDRQYAVRVIAEHAIETGVAQESDVIWMVDGVDVHLDSTFVRVMKKARIRELCGYVQGMRA